MHNDDVKRVKDRLDIVDVIGDKVRLHRAGRSLKGLCPFHDEKTPSFHVSEERQNYHCFGCGRGGDVFSFVMETEGLDFRATLEILAERAGIELTPLEGTKKRVSGNLHEVMDMAGKFFRDTLSAPEGESVLAYLARRGLDARTASRFELGFSGSSWDSLWRKLKDENVSMQEGLDAGLLLEGKNGLYDRFRGRLIFPIRDVSGRLVAFGGRIVDGEGAKYINSPEGILYSKRRNLYLLDKAKTAVRERKRAIVVEGYMDALRLHMHGYEETVASLGTSLTEEQARLIKRFSDRCYICYDSDAAGQEATLRGMYTLQNSGLDVYVISLPVGKDPDDLLTSEGGSERFETALNEARPLILQHLHAVRPQLSDPAARRGGVESLFGGLAQLQPSMIAPCVSDLAGALGFYPHQFWRELDLFRRLKERPEPRRAAGQGQAPEEHRHDPLEAALCALLWRDEDCRCDARPEDILPLIADTRAKEIAMAILMESPQALETRWHTMGEKFPLSFIAKGDTFCDELEFTPDADPWCIVCEALKRKRAEERLKTLDQIMKRHEATLEDMVEFQRLAAELKAPRKTKASA